MRSLTDLSEIPAGSRIFIYGAGLGGGAVYGLLTAAGRGEDVAGFIETRPGGRPLTLCSYAPEAYRDMARPGDVVVIASSSFEPMARTLERLGLDNYSIAMPLLAARLDGQQRWPLEFCRRFLGRRRLSFDIGANVGILSTLFAGFSDRVVAFEPNTTLRPMFELMTRGQDGVELVHLACNATAGRATLHVPLPGSYAGELLFEVAATLNPPEWPAATVEVEQVTLDDYCAGRDMAPDFIKIDAEWLDYEIIRGARTLIARHAPALMFEAYDLDRDCLDELARRYRLLALPEHDQIVATGVEALLPLDEYLRRTGGAPPLNIGALPL